MGPRLSIGTNLGAGGGMFWHSNEEVDELLFIPQRLGLSILIGWDLDYLITKI